MACPNAKDMMEPKPTDKIPCRTCVLGILISWYREAIDAAGEVDLKAELEALLQGNLEDFDGIATKLDDIRAKAPDKLRARLCELNATFDANM